MEYNLKSKTTTAEEAIKLIHDGDLVVIGHAAGVPQKLIQALVDHHEDFHDVDIFHMFTLGDAPYLRSEMKGHFRHITNFVGGNARNAISEGRADFFPAFFYETPKLMKKGILNVDVTLVQVSPPNKDGYCSVGVSCDYTLPACRLAKTVIAEMNPRMPYIEGGDNLIHISKIDRIIEVDYPLFELPLPKISETEESIGRNVASLVDDGSTLQLGIGAIPDAVLGFLHNKKDLGIHTEMFSDGVIDLVKSGVINGSKKEIHPKKLVATFLMGSQKLYDFVHNNPDVELYPVDYVNNPITVMKLDNIVSINSCIEVDLMGQVVSESMGLKQFSGPGGQVDYVRGASMAKNGKSIIAIPSTAKRGSASRIVPFLSQGAAVTTSRNDVDYIVTEYGIAHLRGKTLRERAEALIAIAHPDFRQELQVELSKRF